MHSIVVVKCKHSSFSGRSPTGGMKRNISFFSLEKRKHHILEWTLTELANTLKNVLKEKFLWSFIDFFCLLQIQFSRKLNWKQWSFTKLYDGQEEARTCINVVKLSPNSRVTRKFWKTFPHLIITFNILTAMF